MSESGSSIVLKRSKYRIGIDLVARRVQETAAIVTTDVVAVGRDRASVIGDVGTRASFQDGIPDLERPGDDNTTAVVAANRAIRDGASAIDTASRQASIVAVKSTVSERYAARDPAAATPRLAIMLGTSSVAADGAAGDRQCAAAGDAAASDVALVAANRAIGNRQRPVAVASDAAASTRGPRIKHTSEVVVHGAVGDRQRSPAVKDASAVAHSIPDVAVVRGVVGYDAVGDRQRPRIVVDASPGLNGMVAGDAAVKNCQSRATPATIASDRTAVGTAVGR